MSRDLLTSEEFIRMWDDATTASHAVDGCIEVRDLLDGELIATWYSDGTWVTW